MAVLPSSWKTRGEEDCCAHLKVARGHAVGRGIPCEACLCRAMEATLGSDVVLVAELSKSSRHHSQGMHSLAFAQELSRGVSSCHRMERDDISCDVTSLGTGIKVTRGHMRTWSRPLRDDARRDACLMGDASR